MTNFRIHQPPQNLLIFKTNIASKQDIKALQAIFSSHQSVVDWWVDIEDIDNVMRVEVTNNMIEADIISLLKASRFTCEILD